MYYQNYDFIKKTLAKETKLRERELPSLG